MSPRTKVEHDLLINQASSKLVVSSLSSVKKFDLTLANIWIRVRINLFKAKLLVRLSKL